MAMLSGKTQAGKPVARLQGAVRPPRQQAAPMQSPRAALPPPPIRKPGFGAKAVGTFVPRLTRQAFEKFGFSAATLITDWALIVGADLARATAPERLKWPKGVAAQGKAVEEVDQGRPGATLILRVDDGRALDIQYKSRQIIERINAYFGYRAVADLRILQAPLDRRFAAPLPPAATKPQPVPAEVTAVEDPGLRQALERMAQGVLGRAKAPAKA